MRDRVLNVLSLPITTRDAMTIQARLHNIGQEYPCHFHAV
jgi:hypothetical protein